jgi:hypothetical protein
MSESLRTLAARDAAVELPPYDFAEFTRRAAARKDARDHGAPRLLRLAAMIAPVALLLSIAGVQGDGGAAPRSGLAASAVTTASVSEPALVRVGAASRVLDLEDRIAWFDSMISEAPVAGLSAADREALLSSRDALASSLQRVRYAQTLLAY